MQRPSRSGRRKEQDADIFLALTAKCRAKNPTYASAQERQISGLAKGSGRLKKVSDGLLICFFKFSNPTAFEEQDADVFGLNGQMSDSRIPTYASAQGRQISGLAKGSGRLKKVSDGLTVISVAFGNPAAFEEQDADVFWP